MVQRREIRWTLNNYSSYDSVSQMQTNHGWKSLDQRRTDARLCMLYTVVHGLVANRLPPSFQQPSRMTRHSHSLALSQIHTSVNFYKYSFHLRLLCNGTSYQPMLLCCLHCLSSVWQSGLLTPSYPRHNTPILCNFFIWRGMLLKGILHYVSYSFGLDYGIPYGT